ncbi:hypothetical protein [Flavobacterium sp.]|uniref:hypothetical protein n=1 Tax=Flavobacterium sp. TaxID=239 RepID=UPI00333F14F2
MRNFTIYLVLTLLLFASKLIAQDTFESKAKAIAEKITYITVNEKAKLKIEVEEVNLQLEKGTITREQADQKKIKLAQECANIIENKTALNQLELKGIVQEHVDEMIRGYDVKLNLHDSVIYNGKKNKITAKIIDSTYIDVNGVKKKFVDRKTNNEKRTTSQFVFAFGLNNLVTEGKVSGSDYRYFGSHFYEWGITYKSRLLKKENLLHLKYGFSVMYNNIRPTDNRIFNKNGGQTNLEYSPNELSDSRFKNVYLVVPLHFEFDFSKNKIIKGMSKFQTQKSIRFGLGGYAGLRLKSKQYQLFNDGNGHEVEVMQKGDYNVNDFIYGVSSYVGYRDISLYVKYDLNPMFKNNNVKQNNISLGIRWDWN